MRETQANTSSWKTALCAYVLSISTISFYSILCVLLSYAILDLISPNPGISVHKNPSNFSTSKTRRDSRQIPFSSDILSGKAGPDGNLLPSSETPWDPSTEKGAKTLKYLSKKRFPLTLSQDLPMGWQGMHAPPNLTWPSPNAIKPRSDKHSSPVPIDQIYGQSTGSKGKTNPETWRIPRQRWDPASAKLSGGSERLLKIQWPGFQDKTLWDSSHQKSVTKQRKEWVTRAFSHAWEGYKKHAWGFDEVRPLSNKGVNTFNGWGSTIIQSLDTLLIMNMTREYNYARTHIRAVDWSSVMNSNLNDKSSTNVINIFEAIVKNLGALISAYDLSGDRLMLSKAEELANWLLPAFGTKSGIPIESYQLGLNPAGSPTGVTHLAAASGFVLELTRLSQLTGNEYYINVAQRAMGFLNSKDFTSSSRLGALFPTTFEPEKPQDMKGEYSLGHKTNCYYEYLISLFRDAEGLVIAGKRSNTGETTVYTPSLTQDSCSSAAFIGMGARILGRQNDLDTALQQTETCLWAYDSSPVTLAAESMVVQDPSNTEYWAQVNVTNTTYKNPIGDPIPGVKLEDPRFLAYPDTIEAVFYMWRLTGDRKWQDKGWIMFTNWVEECITETGFAQLKDISQETGAELDDNQGVYVLAESFKYYYLLFTDPNFISLDNFVFNTASHPFKIPQKSSSGLKLWKGPEEKIDLQYNPPIQNQLKKLNQNQPGHVGSWGTVLQQWSWTKENLVEPKIHQNL
ncbi:family 47 glycoside hydrolase [Melampsora larici-populina 98AG31]|uniref:alpha-1,2-Mannosidase n=1 Tax=Melampsora larici-populina (strain 98AG31 / pathotype 3-4-7) TaxID=747676 RepID=F4RPE1_MELLP|nr:family 47 glycoside hydrolase [Melampsora larici-populina 98AG31]EGG05864.1 family 47 glycoside hydrolase [Melampsora larici-populina 98AG31]